MGPPRKRAKGTGRCILLVGVVDPGLSMVLDADESSPIPCVIEFLNVATEELHGTQRIDCTHPSRSDVKPEGGASTKETQ